MKKISLLISVIYLSFLNAGLAADLKLAVTTSFHNSGLSEVLLPEIKKDLDLDVHLIVVGTGQALKLGRAGDVDAILVHSKMAEEEFVRNGYGSHRREIMFNDFILIGPVTDPAQAAKQESAVSALRAIEKNRNLFVSRGDDSGTNRKEIALWVAVGREPAEFPASWYRATGAGMGATLNTASAMDAYVFADRGSWLNFENKRNLAVIFEGDPVLFNQYSFIPVNAARHPHVKHDLALKLENWLVSKKSQAMIGNYKISGEQLFTPNAKTN
ncbi:substrate-binding domain-containing protein [Sneathiella marina]|uniref:Substrate-binding domain-containing protein n=1 Tax=Sneathiella marina TaxID=2950108 RepID=A0ABY4W122_9PROT|nr:substrate-binding domain-containing protein [Sneathiella marina]USG60654.1 substrate-binding domain-containing protein [Sneathiella marina]